MNLHVRALQGRSNVATKSLRRIAKVNLDALRGCRTKLERPSVPTVGGVTRTLGTSTPCVTYLASGPFPPRGAGTPIVPKLMTVGGSVTSRTKRGPILTVRRRVLQDGGVGPSSLSILRDSSRLVSPAVSPNSRILVGASSARVRRKVCTLRSEGNLIILERYEIVPNSGTIVLSARESTRVGAGRLGGRRFGHCGILNHMIDIIG